jgi:hypothetical protein
LELPSPPTNSQHLFDEMWHRNINTAVAVCKDYMFRRRAANIWWITHVQPVHPNVPTKICEHLVVHACATCSSQCSDEELRTFDGSRVCNQFILMFRRRASNIWWITHVQHVHSYVRPAVLTWSP